MSSLPVPVPPQLKKKLIGNQIGSYVVNGTQMLVDKVKESLCQEMVAEFLAINTRMMGKGMDMKESLGREIIMEINTVLMDAGKDTQEYFCKEMAAEIKAALMGIAVGPSKETLDARVNFQQTVLSMNSVITREGADIAPRKQYVGKEVKVLDN